MERTKCSDKMEKNAKVQREWHFLGRVVLKRMEARDFFVNRVMDRFSFVKILVVAKGSQPPSKSTLTNALCLTRIYELFLPQ